ncbi:MAG TPA: hypothetical protein VMN36_06560 [Verrucomicrobiales bacterium]|nr:hypothetical protein [Verrucomicrobiales bacterium]
MKATRIFQSSFAKCLFFLLGAGSSGLASETGDSNIARVSKIVEGITIRFPAGEEDVVDLKKLMAVPDEERSAGHWRQACLELENPAGESFATLLEQTFNYLREVCLEAGALPAAERAAESITEADQPLAADDPRRPSDPLPKAVAENRLASNFGGQQVTYPKELEKAVLSLGDGLAKRYVEHQEQVPKIEPAGPQMDDNFEKSIRQWLRDNTGLYPPVEIEEPVLHGLHDLRGKTRELAATAFSSWGIDFWFAEDLKELLRSGVHIQYFTYDAEAGTANFSLGWSIESHGGSEGFDKSTMPVLLPRPDPGSSEADIRRDVEEALANVQNFNFMGARSPFARSFDFLIAHEYFEALLVSEVIRSQDRRWFCDGMANYLALLFCRNHLGTERADDMFASLFDEKAARAVANEVDLRGWPAAEAIEAGRQAEPKHEGHYYYLATRVIERACGDQGEDFIKRWLEEIRKTHDRRRNMETVTDAYTKVAGTDLLRLMGFVNIQLPGRLTHLTVL